MPDATRAAFFKMVFGAHEGYVCISRLPLAADGEWTDKFFHWPQEADRLDDYIEQYMASNHMYYCPQVFVKPKRRKDCVKSTPNAWADLDDCPPTALKIRPTVTIESSPGRYQAIWRFTDDVAPYDAQDISRRIAYYHAEEGADKSGWDLTQVLRVPNTKNYKYASPTRLAPLVTLIDFLNDDGVKLEELRDAYPQVEEFRLIAELEMPDEVEPAGDVIMRHNRAINPYAMVLYSTPPKEGDWSTSLWNLEMLLFENGLKIEEVFAIAREAQCNKYERDGRGDLVLWKEVVRAREQKEFERQGTGALSTMFDGPGQLLSDEDRVRVARLGPSFVEDYIEWASGASDASVQYHQASAFVTLSSLLASRITLPTGPDVVQLNLWFMILGDTTLTRKTTAMNMGTNLVQEIDDNAVLATDGSVEGIFRAMASRPGRASVFLRDEFSGLLRGMAQKDYLAGMMESLTKLYDGKFQKKVLSKEELLIRDPIFILFTGGIKTAILQLFNRDHVISGFLPRFIFITAEADLSKIKPLGPPTQKIDRGRKEMLKRLQEMYDHYHLAQVPLTFQGITKLGPKKWEAKLTEEAWIKYNQFEMSLLSYAQSHEETIIMMPAMARLAMSGLKAATLLAASRRLEDEVTVTEDDILHAFSYVEAWRDYLIEVLSNIDKTPYEAVIDIVVARVYKDPGVLRGTVMRLERLSAKMADDVISTAEQRGMIKVVDLGGKGKSAKLYPANYKIGE